MACRLVGTKPLSEPMVEYCWLDPIHFHSRKSISKCRLVGKWRPFCLELNMLRVRTWKWYALYVLLCNCSSIHTSLSVVYINITSASPLEPIQPDPRHGLSLCIGVIKTNIEAPHQDPNIRFRLIMTWDICSCGWNIILPGESTDTTFINSTRPLSCDMISQYMLYLDRPPHSLYAYIHLTGDYHMSVVLFSHFNATIQT